MMCSADCPAYALGTWKVLEVLNGSCIASPLAVDPQSHQSHHWLSVVRVLVTGTRSSVWHVLKSN